MTSPMGDPMMDGGPNGGMPPMDDQMIGGDSDGMDMGNDDSAFDTNFDAGVDADENTDPKKFIQQLTGKLSQSLRKYNNDLPKPDEELSKYVAGMILKQTTDGLTDSDKKDIIDKVTGNGSDDNDSGNDMPPTEEPSMDMQDDMGGEQPMMEGFNRRKLINELFQELTTVNNKTNSKIADRPLKNVGFKKKPFTAPSMR